MKLFVRRCDTCGQKVYLNITAYSRSQLRQRFGGEYFFIICNHCRHRNTYGVSNVFAETENDSAIAGGLIGGILGLIAGPAGMLIGGGLGALVGNNSDDEEKRRVHFFNNSR